MCTCKLRGLSQWISFCSLSFLGKNLFPEGIDNCYAASIFTMKPEWGPVILSPILVEVNSYLIFQGSMTACDMFLVSRG